MSEKNQSSEEKLLEKIEKDSAKKSRAQEEGSEIMFGLGLFGIVGWSIALPTVSGIAIGVLLDKRFPQNFSWTLTLLFAGVIVGALITWHWLTEKSKND